MDANTVSRRSFFAILAALASPSVPERDTTPAPLPTDEQISTLLAENERLRASLRRKNVRLSPVRPR